MTQASAPSSGEVRPGHLGGLARACHRAPTVAVTTLAAAYGASERLEAGRLLLVAAAVLAGQLSIGWGNDLLDAGRDRAVGRADKPVAAGQVPVAVVRVACGLAAALAVALSLACGLAAGLVHLLGVAAGWAYDLGIKATVWSWVPYAVAFAALPVFVTLAVPGAGPPPAWVPVAGALLGVGAHLVNVVPDLADDEATGVRGLGHRLGARGATRGAVLALGAATVVMVLGVDAAPVLLLGVALVVVGGLAALATFGHGRTPFHAAIGIAAVDVLLLVVAR